MARNQVEHTLDFLVMPPLPQPEIIAKTLAIDAHQKVKSGPELVLYHCTPMPPAAPPAPVSCMINFDDYSDFSDDDEEEAPSYHAAGKSLEDNAVQWSRESLLAVKVALSP
jgi:hypothetical protein